MSDQIIIIQSEPRTYERSAKKGTGVVGRDVWHFKEIRETLWGTGSPTKGLNRLWGPPRIRTRL
jgi:hypothetical protein